MTTATDIAATSAASAETPGGTAPGGGGSGQEPPPAIVGQRPASRRKWVLALMLGLLFLLLLALGAWYLLFRKPIADIIPPAVVQLMPSYQYSFAGVTKPQDIAASADGSRVYVTQTEGTEDTVILDKSGKQLGKLQLPQGTTGHPFYVAVSPKTGEVYASDRRDGTVFVFKPDGTYEKDFDNGTKDPWQPLGISFDAAGNLFVGDVGPHGPVVHEFGPDGKPVADFGASSGLGTPSGIAEDSNGNVYVTDTNNGRMLIFSPTGALIGQIAKGMTDASLGLPVGVAFDDKGHILVVDSAGSAIQIYSPIKSGASSLEYVGHVGQQGAADGSFLYPNGMHLDAQGRIYVADYGNDRAQVWSY